MPRRRQRKAKKTPYRKGKKGRKYAKAAALTTFSRGPGFGDMTFVKLNYADTVQLTGLPSSIPYVFRGNSLFDPNLTATGHQPLYFDQYSAVYDRYRVLGSSIRLDVVNISAGSACYMVVEANTDQSTFTSISDIYEQGRSRAPRIIPVASRISVRHKQYASTRKVCGLTKSQVMDDTFAALVTTNPGNVWYWNILFGSTDQTTSINVNFVVKITYYVQFFDRKQGVPS